LRPILPTWWKLYLQVIESFEISFHVNLQMIHFTHGSELHQTLSSAVVAEALLIFRKFFRPSPTYSHVTDQFACPLSHRMFSASSDGNAGCFDIFYGFWIQMCV
jgi:hypothetical protein